jgi:hypothetical protein
VSNWFKKDEEPEARGLVTLLQRVALVVAAWSLSVLAAALIAPHVADLIAPLPKALRFGSNLPSMFGLENVDSKTSGQEVLRPWTPVPSSACVALPPLDRQIVEGESVPLADLVDVQCAGDAGAANNTSACDGHIRLWMPGTMHGGVFVAPDGGQAAQTESVDILPGGPLSTVTAQIVVDAGSAQTVVCAPTGLAIAAGDSFSANRRLAYIPVEAGAPVDSGATDSGTDSGGGGGPTCAAMVTDTLPVAACWSGDVGVTLSGSNVTAWADQTGNANTWTSSTPVTISALNGHNAPTFDGSSSIMTLTSPTFTGGYTAFFVFKQAAQPSFASLWNASGNFNSWIQAGPILSLTDIGTLNDTNSLTIGTTYCAIVGSLGASSFVQLEPNAATSGSVTASTISSINLAESYVGGLGIFSGQIAAIVVYAGAISTPDVAANYATLKAKWACQ